MAPATTGEIAPTIAPPVNSIATAEPSLPPATDSIAAAIMIEFTETSTMPSSARLSVQLDPAVRPEEGEGQRRHRDQPEEDHRPPADAIGDRAHERPGEDPEQRQQPEVRAHDYVGVAEVLGHVEHEKDGEGVVRHPAQGSDGDERDHGPVAEQRSRRAEVVAQPHARLRTGAGGLEAQQDHDPVTTAGPTCSSATVRQPSPPHSRPAKLIPPSSTPITNGAEESADRSAGAVRGNREGATLRVAHGQLREGGAACHIEVPAPAIATARRINQ